MYDAARLRITLRDLDPVPWREIEMPFSMSFKGLHAAIVAVFGATCWAPPCLQMGASSAVI